MLQHHAMKKTIITKDTNINIRLDGADKAMIERAAKKTKVRASRFVRDAAVEKAKTLSGLKS